MGSTPSYAFAAPGIHPVTLTLADDEAARPSSSSPARALLQWAPDCRQTQRMVVAYPGVRVSCPARVKLAGCLLKLQVVLKKHSTGKKLRTKGLARSAESS